MRAGNLGKPIFNPLTGETYADGVIPASAITLVREEGPGRAAEPDARRASPTTSTRCPKATNRNNKFDVKIDHQFSTRMTAFGRVSHRKANNFEPPPIPGETGSPSNNELHVLNDQVAGGVTYSPTADLAARVPARLVAHQGRQGAARRRRSRPCSSSTASRACRPIRASPAV